MDTVRVGVGEPAQRESVRHETGAETEPAEQESGGIVGYQFTQKAQRRESRAERKEEGQRPNAMIMGCGLGAIIKTDHRKAADQSTDSVQTEQFPKRSVKILAEDERMAIIAIAITEGTEWNEGP